jgi:hypothetical protein
VNVIVPMYVWIDGNLERIKEDSHHFVVPAEVARIGFDSGDILFMRGFTEQKLEAVRVGRSFSLKPRERRSQARSRTRGRRGSRRIGYKYEFRCVIHMLDTSKKSAAIVVLAKQIVDPIAEAFGKDAQQRHWPDGWSALYTHAENRELLGIRQRFDQFKAEAGSQNKVHR